MAFKPSLLQVSVSISCKFYLAQKFAGHVADSQALFSSFLQAKQARILVAEVRESFYGKLKAYCEAVHMPPPNGRRSCCFPTIDGSPRL
jgi:hypothetical protein